MSERVVTVNDLLDGHVTLDIQCLDRIYLNAYIPTLQTSAQVAAFLTGTWAFHFPPQPCSSSLVTASADRCGRSPTRATAPG